jgi:TatD DNase family protein
MLATDLDLPLVLHSRQAEEKLVEVLPRDIQVPVILHCYTGPSGPALEAARRGWFVSFAGALTYRKNGHLRETLSLLPREQVLVETDSPFMAPEPLRGRICEPSFVENTARVVAGTWGTTEEEAFGVLLGNSLGAFRLGEHDRPSVVYLLGGRAYVNLTGKCCNSCRFCIRRIRNGLGGYDLAHQGDDPSEARVLGSLSRLALRGLEELVFCGYGEPTARPGLLRKAAGLARSRGWRLRLNTNGLALAFSSREETEGMIRLFDTVSVSLNAFDSGSYDALCRPGVESAWERLISFIRLAGETGVEVRLTAVAQEGLDMDAVRSVAAGLGYTLTVRGT